MNIIPGIITSPVNMEDRKNLGITAGDTVRVHQKIKDDKGKTRLQVFEGLVLARKHGSEAGATFTVRKMVDGIGVEKIFPLYSPMIDKIEITRRSKVRRAKLYYIREKVAREIKRQMRRMRLMSVSSESETETAARSAKEAADEATRVAAAAKVAAEAVAQAEAEAKAIEEAKVAEVVEEATPVAAEETKVEEEVAPEAK
jgi:large subunit ribosomal protein L19